MSLDCNVKGMNILLISFDARFISNGIRTLHNILIEKGYKSTLFFCNNDKYSFRPNINDSIISALQKFKPGVVGVSLFSFNYELAKDATKLIKEYCANIKIIWGGMASYNITE